MRRLTVHLVYHDRYDLNFGEHVFPAQKYRLVRERLLAEGVAAAVDFVAPEPATDEDMRLVHEAEWIGRLRAGTLSYLERMRLEIPWSPAVRDGFWHGTGGTILAARLALAHHVGFNIGGGFHHAFPAHGEGFCAVNDIAVAIRRLQHDGAIARAMVVDCDVHHGNGTAAIFAGDDSVFTLSIHQYNNYPGEKPPSSVDIHLDDGTGDAEYLERLEAALIPAMAEFDPHLLIYVAGADPYGFDRLGGLALTISGLMRRDRFVLDSALARGAAAAVVLAGGYAADTNETVAIHVNTVRAAQQALTRAAG
ncbi:MAG: histone deacetylase family protein [Bryobacteraceae bacterium]